MAQIDPHILAHLEWLGFVKPTGLVVSAHALVHAGAVLDRRDSEGQRLLRQCVAERIFDPKDGPAPWLPDFRIFARSTLGWTFSPKWYAGTDEAPLPSELEVAFTAPGQEGTLRPTYAVREPAPQAGGPEWQLLVDVLEPGEDLDRVVRKGTGPELSPNGRMERLLRQTGVLAGALFNGRTLRLVAAPRGESSGWIDFNVADMVQTAGRPISTALRLLLSEQRLLALPTKERLPALLVDSRKFQNEVSERLSEQVLHALYELLRGFQSADDASKGRLLEKPLADHPEEVYRGLLTVLLRLVFLLFAEERDLLPEDETFVRSYSIAGLHDRLREDAALYPDTMDQRYGAWAQLLVLFRMIFDGATSGSMTLPERHGVLFDPDRFPFLEGRSAPLAKGNRIDLPLVPDGTIHRALEKLLLLDGERISYRALDVEEIGSVYQAMMGFRLETASGTSLALKVQKKWAAPITVDLEALLKVKAGERRKWLEERTGRRFGDAVVAAVKAAGSLTDLHAALGSVVDRDATPDLVPEGAMVLQPSEERRRSGSHYTPRSLTEPIVRTTLEPVLARLRGPEGQPPTPGQILDLKVCDPAMGSGAFLVEACRQLGDALLEAWRFHGGMPPVMPDEDEVIHARRFVAQRCLYGVDRNPVAVDLAKVSLWLATLAKDHPLTFVDHALRCGDSLVGLSHEQVESFHWDGAAPKFQVGLETQRIREHLARAAECRARIRDADESVPDGTLRQSWHQSQAEASKVRLLGDLVVLAFFDGENDRERESNRAKSAQVIANGAMTTLARQVAQRQAAEPPLIAFHWPIEFPEVFAREHPGFDAIVGNPPFAGKNTIAEANPEGYLDWLKLLHPETHGNADLVAHFFRRAFTLLREGGALGLIATKTVAQGDTRSSGLRWICTHGGEIFSARRRLRWPGLAAVVVSVVHLTRGPFYGKRRLDGREVDQITAFLFHRGASQDPAPLAVNAGKSFVGSYILGMGFTFDDSDTSGATTSLADMRQLIAKGPTNQEVIFPYIGGDEVNTSPTHAHHRFTINFGERSETECRKRWPRLMAIVEEKVKPERLKNNREGYRRYWWQFAEKRVELLRALPRVKRVLVTCRHQPHWCLTYLSSRAVFAESLLVFPVEDESTFPLLQSRVHEVWARFFGSSLADTLRYNPSDCFETFPWPAAPPTGTNMAEPGKIYFEQRAEWMVRSKQGLTHTYNRFHDPDEREPGILKLRELHAAMDRAVLSAYGWTDIKTDCEFLLDYEVDEEEGAGKKKPWRYRWPDEVCEEVLARLLELNAERAREETRAGSEAGGAAPGTMGVAAKSAAPKKGTKRKSKDTDTGDLF